MCSIELARLLQGVLSFPESSAEVVACEFRCLQPTVEEFSPDLWIPLFRITSVQGCLFILGHFESR